ncbi:hypothetical protein [Solimonas sp. K1W22B-7]|uniref:hypothetical protein n=1 Tax=Solimonas sp. K1W22B-7 TaxID=2303331 RepID=UPI0013C45F39|nr:hypothetical protein [Solimonas sp. K1W22B-7]
MSPSESDTAPVPYAWYAAAAAIVLIFAALFWVNREDAPRPAPRPAAASGETPYKEWPAPAAAQPAWPAAPVAAADDGDMIVDPSVAEAEEAEKHADPYEISEALVMPDEGSRVQPSYADIVTAAEDEPETPKTDGEAETAVAQ